MPYKDPAKRKEMLERVRPAKGRAPFQRNSSRHVALLYMKVHKNRPVTLQELTEMNASLFKTEGQRAMKSLYQKGFVRPVGDGWIITEKGIGAVYDFAIKYSGPTKPAD